MTKPEYTAKLAELEKLAPKNLLLNKLRGGTSAVNDVLLANELKKAKAIEAERSLPDDPVGDDRLRAMRTDLRKLFGERSVLSNRFHGCTTNTDRAHVSEDIQVVQRNIERLMGWIREYIVHGTIPEGGMKYYIPKDGLELAKKKASLASSISRKAREVEALRKGDLMDMATMRKVEKEEGKLTDLKMQLANVKEAISHL